MIKKLVFASAALLMCFSISAQNYFTLKGGMNFTHPSVPSPYGYKTGMGAKVGASYSINLYENLSLEPGLTICFHTWKFDDLEVFTGEGDMLEEGVDHKFQEVELSVPLLIDYSIPLDPVGLHIFIGPQLNYGLSNKLKTDTPIGGNDMGNTIDMYDDGIGFKYKRFGVAWNIGAGIILPSYISLDFTVSLGLTNMANASYGIHKNSFAITLGYNL
jgi:hypothetical protein